MKAAIPNYMTRHLEGRDTAPGHRFSLYFPVWQDNWKRAEGGKKDALKTVAKTLPPGSKKLAENLRQRQQALALQNPDLAYFPAKSNSPFMTGIGNEHPLENGFAFLNPYGLPYLPGSSVKGVLRSAAEELALGLYGETQGWDMLSVWWLFGFEAGNAAISQKPYKGDRVLVEEAERRQQAFQAWVKKAAFEHETLERFIDAVVTDKYKKESLKNDPQRFLSSLSDEISLQGAMRFWDVYPQSASLTMGILTPHHPGYFNGKNAPHDSEQPVPNVFLTIPPGSDFDFYCTCAKTRLPEALQQNWQALIKSAFEHAFDWLGFGAKTAVGYGQMTQHNEYLHDFENRKKDAFIKEEKDRQQQERKEELAAYTPIAQQFIEAMEEGNWREDKNAFWQGDVVDKWLTRLSEELDTTVITYLAELFNRHFPGLLDDPDKVQGKKKKPVFSERQRKLAILLNSHKSCNEK
ncbi:MAG: type III-B CRISPR module RAMP protein Cmr6 [Methylomicrobium sp.]|nr:type III-B CRISPR module RAMP protein Cmr6 [Methylomicrobium sp.]